MRLEQYRRHTRSPNMPFRLEDRIPEVRQALRESPSYRQAARKLGTSETTLADFCRRFDIQGPDLIYWYIQGRLRNQSPIAGFDELPRMFPIPRPKEPKKFEHPLRGISSLKPLPPGEPLSVEHIRRAVCERFGLTREQLMGRKKPHRLSHPRQLAMLLTRELTNYSLPRIARLFGRDDHTTVMYAIEAAQRRVDAKPEWMEHYTALKNHLTYRPANDEQG